MLQERLEQHQYYVRLRTYANAILKRVIEADLEVNWEGATTAKQEINQLENIRKR